MEPKDTIYDAIVIGAGPGGLQAAIYLGRYNRKVLILDRGGGRTMHARRIENFLTQPATTGRQIIAAGLEQAKRFGAELQKARVTKVAKADDGFEVRAGAAIYRGRYVLVSSGATDRLPPLKNLGRFFAESFFTCIDCDGYRTTARRLLVMGGDFSAVRHAFAAKLMYTPDVRLLVSAYEIPGDVRDELRAAGIETFSGEAQSLEGEAELRGVRLRDGRMIECEVVLSTLGYDLNDDFLADLPLDRYGERGKYATSRQYESSVRGLYIVGPLAGEDQAIIAAGEGAVAAIDINRQLLSL